MNAPYLLFALTVGTVILERVNVLSTISIPQFTALFFLFLITIVHLKNNKDTNVSKRYIFIVYLILLFISFEIISGLINGVSNGIIALLRSRAISLILFFSGSIGAYNYLLYKNKTQTESLLNIMTLSGIVLLLSLILSSFGLYQLETAVNTSHRYYLSELMHYRTSGLLTNFGDLAIWLSLISSIALHLHYVSKQNKFSSRIFLLLLPFGVIAAESRNVLLALSATIFIYLWRNKSQQLRNTTKYILAVVFMVLIFAVITYKFEMLSQMSATQIELRGRTDTRLDQYVGTLKLLKEFPILGAGPGNLTFLIEHVKAGMIEVNVHNIFLQAAARAGIGSIFLLICIIYIGIRLYSYNQKATLPSYIWPAYIGFIIAIQFYPPLSYGSPVFWIPLGIYATFASQANTKKNRCGR